jgi:Fe-S-cluster containining protein
MTTGNRPGGAHTRRDVGQAPVARGTNVEQLTDEIQRTVYRERLDTFLASRDAGRTLTAQALKQGILLEVVVGAAATVSSYADEALAIVAAEYRPQLACRKGCDSCCCKPGVLVSIPELVRILQTVASAFSEDQVARLRERTRAYGEQLDGRDFNALVDDRIPCPLLVEGCCSVYEDRPLVCRGYNSTSVEACRAAERNATALVPIFALLKDVTDGATVGVAQQLSAAGLNDALVDLGTALQIALAEDSTALPKLIQQDDCLAAAENRRWTADLWTRVRETAISIGVKL